MEFIKKNLTGTVGFVIFIAAFVVVAYLYNNGSLSFLPLTDKKNIIDIVFTDKEYQQNFNKKYSGLVYEMAGFEQTEDWEGDFNLDDTIFFEGETSVSLTSKNHETNAISLDKNLDLSDYESIKLLIYSDKLSNSDNLESLNLRFSDEDGSLYYEYPILNIKVGWNFFRMSKDNFIYSGKTKAKTEESTVSAKAAGRFSWADIEKVTISLTSRPNTKIELFFDRLWAEKNEDYQEDFKAANYNVLSLKNYQDKDYANIWCINGSVALLKKVTSVKDFSYTAKLIPQKKGALGITARTDMATNYGYFLTFGGIDLGTWTLYKIGKPVNKATSIILDQGQINNFIIEKDKPLWLRIETKGAKISGYFSTDGINFTKLSEVDDKEHKSGGIGFYASGSSFLVESIDFKQ